MGTLKFIFIFLAAFVVIVSADLPQLDEYWKRREDEAKDNIVEAYRPDPFKVTDQFNDKVNQ